MEVLVTLIMSWLAINFGVSVPNELPGMQFKPPIELGFLYYGASTPEAQSKVRKALAGVAVGKRQAAASLCDTVHHTILLPEGWSVRKPSDVSLVVHELVHHLQTTSGLRYPCSEEREILAYAAQEKWLGEYGTSLEREFGIDAMTLFVRTHCHM